MSKKKSTGKVNSKRIPSLNGKPLSAGDVLFRKLRDGWYIAARILYVDPSELWSTVVATTEYFEKHPPKLNDPTLQRTFLETGHDEKSLNGPAMRWIGGGPIKGWTKLGNLQPTAEDKKMVKKCMIFSGGLDGEEAHTKWQKQYQREEYEKEMAEEEVKWERKRKAALRKAKPKTMMSENDFWDLINLIDWSKRNDEHKLKPIATALAKKTRTDIKRFAERLAYVLYQLDTRAHGMCLAEPLGDCEDYVSPDSFLYARCWVVAKGRKVYKGVLLDPEKFDENEFEALLYIANKAWEEKTGDDFEYETGLDYESFSNQKGWK